jgi:predicted DsbA family dithiol-disulfide isomerase
MNARLTNVTARRGKVPSSAALHVDVVADLICPFCYIGKRRLDRALKAVQGPSEVNWYPWQLNPDMPPEGLPIDEYFRRRFRGRDNIEPVLESLAEEGRSVGIDFRFDRLSRVPNTMAAHQVMYLAQTQGANQSMLAETLMSAFFEHGADLGDRDLLAGIARRVGLTPEDVVIATECQSTRQAVQSREAKVRGSGLSGVPGFMLNRRLLVVGAQEPDVMINAFDRAMFGEGTDQLVSPALH